MQRYGWFSVGAQLMPELNAGQTAPFSDFKLNLMKERA